MVKAGLELFGAAGPAAVAALAGDGRPVMLDLKLHDIPATVAGGMRAAARAGAELVTVHPRRPGHAGGRRRGRRRPLPGGRGDDPDQRRPADLAAVGLPPAAEAVPRGWPGLAVRSGCRASSARRLRWPPCAPHSAPRSS